MRPNPLEPPAIVRPAEDLAALLAVATSEHEAGQRAERASLEHYRKAGEALLRAKAAAITGQALAEGEALLNSPDVTPEELVALIKWAEQLTLKWRWELQRTRHNLGCSYLQLSPKEQRTFMKEAPPELRRELKEWLEANT